MIFHDLPGKYGFLRLIVSNVDIVWFNHNIFLVDLEQVFYEIFLGQKSFCHFFKIKVYYIFLQEQLHSNVAAQIWKISKTRYQK